MQKGEEKKVEATAAALKKLEAKDFKFHQSSAEDIVTNLGSSVKKGLSDSEVERRRAKHGSNELDDEEPTSLWDKIVEQFEDLLARILLVAATISTIIALMDDGDEGIAGFVEPFVILLILVLNAMVAIYQDQDAENAIDALKDMQALTCTVLRNGKKVEIDSKDLVPGDICFVKMGEVVPADIRIC